MPLTVKSVLAEDPRSWISGGFLLENEIAIDLPKAPTDRRGILSRTSETGRPGGIGSRFQEAALTGGFHPRFAKPSRPDGEAGEAGKTGSGRPAPAGVRFTDMVFRLPDPDAQAMGLNGRRKLLARLDCDTDWADPCGFLMKMFARKGSESPIKKHLRLWGQQRARQAQEAVENEAFQTEAVSSVRTTTLARGRYNNTIERRKFENIGKFENYLNMSRSMPRRNGVSNRASTHAWPAGASAATAGLSFRIHRLALGLR